MEKTIQLDEATFLEIDDLLIKLHTAQAMMQWIVEDGKTLEPWQREMYFSDRAVIHDGLSKIRHLIGEVF